MLDMYTGENEHSLQHTELQTFVPSLDVNKKEKKRKTKSKAIPVTARGGHYSF
jgi:hypothetical protein